MEAEFLVILPDRFEAVAEVAVLQLAALVAFKHFLFGAVEAAADAIILLFLLVEEHVDVEV